MLARQRELALLSDCCAVLVPGHPRLACDSISVPENPRVFPS